MYEQEIRNLEAVLKQAATWPEGEMRDERFKTYYPVWSKFKKLQLYSEREEILKAILLERPDYPQSLSKDEQTLLILKYTIQKEMSRNPIEYVGLGIFVHAWDKLNAKIAEDTIDRLYPDCTPEEREATVRAYKKTGDPN